MLGRREATIAMIVKVSPPFERTIAKKGTAKIKGKKKVTHEAMKRDLLFLFIILPSLD